MYDDGTGPTLFAAGALAGAVQKWNGTSWVPFGGGLFNGAFDDFAFATTLAVHDDGLGGGPALYVAGQFSRLGSEMGPSLFGNVARSYGGNCLRSGEVGQLPIADGEVPVLRQGIFEGGEVVDSPPARLVAAVAELGEQRCRVRLGALDQKHAKRNCHWPSTDSLSRARLRP